MSIPAGTRLGPYEILAPLGAGGMGEVYRARDTRLDRDVAVKVLPSHLSDNAELRQRFEREAKAISQLSHPHICALYDVGREGGVEYLVMELLEGQTLADRLDRGPLPTEQALKVGVEIADALEKAHKRGIVHRDLKPGNVMLTKSGVKLLDFGLAKSMAPERDADITSLPTEAPRPLTEKGTVMGTFQYMAPEQLEGKDADARSDIFALGCVLYEMASGKKAFSGSSRASLIGAIMSTEPAPISTIAPMAPPALERVVKTCLAKDPDERWQSAHDVKSELAWIAEAGSQAGAPATVVSRRKSRERMAWAGFAAALAAAAVFAVLWLRGRALRGPVMRVSLNAPEDARLLLFNDPSGAGTLSPDGRWIAFIASQNGKFQLWVRSLDSTEAHPIPGVEQALYPFWSPDSKWLGFFAGGRLQKVSLSGGAPQVLAETENGRGATWNHDDVILFAPDAYGGLSRVSASGGPVTAVTRLSTRTHQSTHRFPSFLPDGRHFLYLGSGTDLHGRTPTDGIYVGSLDGGEGKFVLASDSQAVYSNGYLLTMRGAELQAMRFDPSTFVIRGEPFTLANPVQRDWGRFAGAFSISSTGLLAFHGGSPGGSNELAWFDRSGRRLETIGQPANYTDPSLSPDGRRIAVSIQDPTTLSYEILIFGETPGTPPTRFTFPPSSNGFPVWSRDGAELLFSSNRTGRGDLYSKAISGREPERARPSSGEDYPTDWSPDGRFIVFGMFHSEDSARTQLWIAPAAPGAKPYLFAKEGIKDPVARFSPDGKWIAYNSYESGTSKIYVTSFPEAAGKWQVSPAGGSEPRWRRDGKAIFYLAEDGGLTEAEVSLGTSVEVGTVRPLFRIPVQPQTSEWSYDVSPDGNRFLIVAPAQSERKAESITLVTNWMADLNR